MINPYEIYDILQDYGSGPELIKDVVIGLVWTCCEADAVGLAMSPGVATRTLAWPGTLHNKPVRELAAWLRKFGPYESTVGMAAVNAAINRLQKLPEGITLNSGQGPGSNLAVFEHFLPMIRGKRIVVIGRYPGLDHFATTHQLDMVVVERQPVEGDLPDVASEYLLPEAEWVFLTATTIPNKTFPRLAELSRNATTVLMGPTTPWIPDLYHFGVDYLAGVEVVDKDALQKTVAQGGGVRIFDSAVRYRVAPLNMDAAKQWSKAMIADTCQQRDTLKQQMDTWYTDGKTQRFPEFGRLEATDLRLSRLDTCFKKLLDARPGP